LRSLWALGRWCRVGSGCRPSSQTADQSDIVESRIVEAVHCCYTSSLRAVVDKSTVTLRDEEQALYVCGCISRKMIFQVGDSRSGRKVANPERMTGLLGLTGRASREGRNSNWSRGTSSVRCCCKCVSRCLSRFICLDLTRVCIATR
jgi:hypothetical protein